MLHVYHSEIFVIDTTRKKSRDQAVPHQNLASLAD